MLPIGASSLPTEHKSAANCNPELLAQAEQDLCRFDSRSPLGGTFNVEHSPQIVAIGGIEVGGGPAGRAETDLIKPPTAEGYLITCQTFPTLSPFMSPGVVSPM